MIRQNICVIKLAVMILVISMVGTLRAREAKTSPPATLGDAAKVLDLTTFPLMPGGKLAGPPRLANLGYSAKGGVREAYAFQQMTLEAQGWKLLPGEYVTDMACSGMFGKDGYTVSALTSADTGGMVRIQVKNHGNVDPGKLPVPSDAKPQYAFPTSAAYVTETPVKETAAALKKLLAEQGWEPYGSAGDQLFFKKNAIRISARPLAAPAQGNKTMIQLSSELLSADLPAPPVLLSAAYADVTKTLSIDVAMSPEELKTFYVKVMANAGWKPTTENLVKIDFDQLMIFRNPAKDLATLKMHTIDGKVRATLKYETAAEFEEGMRLAKEEDAKRKAELARQKEMTGKTAEKGVETVAITVPTGAKKVERTRNGLEFKLPSGTAAVTVETIRADLIKQGWKANPVRLDAVAGSLVLKKNAGSLVTIVYTDIGVNDAEFSITLINAKLEATGAK